jgi:hypothetical protein
MLRQSAVDAKTNGISLPSTLLDTVNITDAAGPADRLHCRRQAVTSIVTRDGLRTLTVEVNGLHVCRRLKSRL